MTLWSQHVTSRLAVRTCMRTTELDLNLGAIMAPKKSDNAKKRTADAQEESFRVYLFLASDRYMCVEILLYSAILFTSQFTGHVIAAKCSYEEIPSILNEETLSGERWKEILIFC